MSIVSVTRAAIAWALFGEVRLDPYRATSPSELNFAE